MRLAWAKLTTWAKVAVVALALPGVVWLAIAVFGWITGKTVGLRIDSEGVKVTLSDDSGDDSGDDSDDDSGDDSGDDSDDDSDDDSGDDDDGSEESRIPYAALTIAGVAEYAAAAEAASALADVANQ